MASIMLKAALLLFLALFTASNAQYSTDIQRYSNDRSQLGKVSDGVSANTRTLKVYLENANFSSSGMRALGKILTKLLVFKEEQLPQHSRGTLYDHYQLILNALKDDICHLFKITHLVDETSTCSLQEMKRLKTLLDLHANHHTLFSSDYIRTSTAFNAPHCYCPWFSYNVLNNNCPRANLGNDILELDQKCQFCSNPRSLSTSVLTCACQENPRGAGC